MLTRAEKNLIQNELIKVINANPQGINTRELISFVMKAISNTIPHANRHHVAGMLSWVWRNNGYKFIVRTPGYSVIA